MNKLWDKGVEIDKKVESFTVGNDYQLDMVLVPYDCIASKAHVKMLLKMGYINKIEQKTIDKTLDEIIYLHKNRKFKILKSEEDCHTAIENFLVKKLNNVGEKVHTARSRNDQVLTALRLFYKDELSKINSLSKNWIKALESFSNDNNEVIFPGYTHMQKAMPSSMPLWADAYIESMKDDLIILETVNSLIDQSPLGSAAGFGVPIDIDRKMTAKELNFKKVQGNPIYCQISRGKFEISILQSLSQILLTINRLCSDVIQFSMKEFGYFSLPESFCTGSSIMPQKNNPDILELLRGSYHIMLGYEAQVKSLSSNLISGYNRDIQLSKEPVMKGLKLAVDCLSVNISLLSNLKVNKLKCSEAMTEELYATAKVYDLVKNGVPFRQAYKEVAKTIK